MRPISHTAHPLPLPPPPLNPPSQGSHSSSVSHSQQSKSNMSQPIDSGPSQAETDSMCNCPAVDFESHSLSKTDSLSTSAFLASIHHPSTTRPQSLSPSRSADDKLDKLIDLVQLNSKSISLLEPLHNLGTDNKLDKTKQTTISGHLLLL